MNQALILETLKKYKAENAQKYGIYSIGLFGSYAKGVAKSDSDIDVVIETDEPDPFKLVHIKEELQGILKKNIDVVRKREGMNRYLKKNIEKEAIYV